MRECWQGVHCVYISIEPLTVSVLGVLTRGRTTLSLYTSVSVDTLMLTYSVKSLLQRTL